MNATIALIIFALSTISSPLAAGSSPTPPPVNPAAENQIARGGEARDESLENRENRSADRGNYNRSENLENRQENSENRQDSR